MSDIASAASSAVVATPSMASSVGGELARSPITIIALSGVILVVVFAGMVLLRLPKAEDLETQKVRFAAATFTGLLLIFVFAAVLYFSDGRADAANAGKNIFEKAMTAMTPLIGVIVGYLFGTRTKPAPADAAKPQS